MNDPKSPAGSLLQFIAQMPKAELHVHLEGSISPTTLLHLARRHGLEDRLPSNDPARLSEWFRFTDFPHFIEIYLTISDCLRDAEDFAFITEAYAAELARQAVCYAEMTVTPFTHTHIQAKSMPLEAILEGLATGRDNARKNHGVTINWVFDVPRNFSFSGSGRTYDPAPAEITLDYALKGRNVGVVGFGLGGNEVGAPPEPFAHAFHKAVDAGLMSAPHAGETQGSASVWGVLQNLRAHRIGHGVRAIEDASLLALLHDTQIPLEVNISSNICLHVFPSLERHPFPLLDNMGLMVTVNSDDPPLFNTSLLEEYELLARIYGYEAQGIARIARNAFLAAAAPKTQKSALLNHFDRWIAQNLPRLQHAQTQTDPAAH